MRARKSPALGEAPIVPGKVDRHLNITPLATGPHRLSSRPPYAEAAEATKAEAEHRGMPVPATALMGEQHV